ncbi:tail completion protein gp17 [Sphingopyxis macrogoltabida]|uniref:DUF3168 domain-containing protein n=1 Tax=Sphingopyxis macrogoltabida TaxID=33050 RepID=A0AAC8Z1T4_SPHMC|nr:DUF3168 domain-containing protein [Sphingopyxis macrogoltabida]ALJ14121.1 hypothetical protein LH19_14705 [Sphingopyxis macrogoltabida]AMU90388.1 hypothetical protein ATM17_15285 [Sphingopyxis macrogoltabida]
MEEALRSRLKAAGPVAAIVGTRIDWGLRPQGDPYPSVVLKVISDPMPQDYKGFIAMRETRVQIDCLADDRLTAIALRKAVITAIVAGGTYFGTRFGRAFIDSVRDLGAKTGTEFVHRDSIDALIWHN